MQPNENIPAKLLKPYDPVETEGRIYKLWEESGFFNPDICAEKGVTKSDAKPYTIMMPPPNVTGVLHMGHAMMLTLQDIMIRYKRMQGFRTLWLPGTDHAAIATQSKVEKEISKKEGKSRHDLGREEMLKHISQFAQESHDTIASQIRVMGSSCDWSREAFTLDEKRTTAVNTMFKKMYDDGLIYRGHRIVNWDPKGQTTIADDEIVYEERKAKLYTFKYSKDFPIAISTTRPETKIGDNAVAVNPSDERYKDLIGKEYDVDFFGGTKLHIKIIADEGIEKDFGTGALGVTPAHSAIDWEMAQKNDLPVVPVINEYGKMTAGGEAIVGKKVTEAREIIVAWLKEQNLLEQEKEIDQNVPTAERTGGIVEPLPKLQWFVNVNKEIPGRGKTLKDLMREPVADQKIKIIPDYFNKTYFHWIDNLRDWCISRQIWYGHRVPVWYKDQEIILPTEIKVFLARHGESTANAEGVFAGAGYDAELTEKGREQAKLLAESFKDKGITKIISSDLSRSKETAKIIADTIGIKEIIELPELKEIDAGELARTPYIGKENNSGLRYIESGKGETLESLEQRTTYVLNYLRNISTSENILIVGHNAFNCCLRANLDGKSKEEYVAYREKIGLAKNGSVFEFTLLNNPQGENLIQDEDTLDTWFSSALWTFSTLGWPEKTKDLELYHPTDVLETGYEILFFWVARMILMTGYALDTIPFHTVYLHGTVRDGQGRKMSKSLGNGIDPLDIAKKYGADAGRMALIVGTAAGTDSKISEDKIKGYKHFANKMWNIVRFVMSNSSELDKSGELNDADQGLRKEFDDILADITKDIEEYRLYLASEKLYHYVWHRFADTILEESKDIFLNGQDEIKASREKVLHSITEDFLKALHPFMPFVTEELWNLLGHEEQLLLVQSWPVK